VAEAYSPEAVLATRILAYLEATDSGSRRYTTIARDLGITWGEEETFDTALHYLVDRGDVRIYASPLGFVFYELTSRWGS
jgi:hypothetical protein